MAKKFDVIAIGDTTLDVFMQLEDASVKCEHGKMNCMLCFRFADKIPVKKVTKVPAVGNAANVAVGAARLGLKSALYTIIGKDQSGKEAFETLKKEKVAKDYIIWDKKRGTNYSTVLNFDGDRTILVFHEPRTYRLPKLAIAAWVYLTATGTHDQKMHNQVIEYAKKSGAKLAFNPGDQQMKEGFEAMKNVVAACEILFVNKEEAERLLEKTGEVKTLAQDLHNAGAKIVVITYGGKGSYCFDGINLYFLDILHWPNIENTGCGDSYATGFMTALHLGKQIPEAMQWGAANAASVLQKIGAQEGLLTKPKLLTILKKNPQLQPKKI